MNMTDSSRLWIIATLTGSRLPTAPDAETLLAAAGNEGVLLLLEQAMASHPDAAEIPTELREAVQTAAKLDLFDQFAMLSEQRKIFQVLSETNLRFLVLKGGGLAHWLYDKPYLRLVTDLDILLPAFEDLQPLALALREHGYVLAPGSGDRIGNERPLMKPGGPYGQYTVDAHWALLNSPILAECFGFDEMMAESIILPDCAGARALSPVHAMFNACCHRALNLPYTYVQGIQNAHSLRWLWDIHLLSKSLNAADWQQLDALARAKGLCGILADALGSAADECGSPVPETLLAEWRRIAGTEQVRMQWFTSWSRYQWQQFLASDSQWRGRLAWLGQRLWPDSEAMRARYGHAGDPGWRVLWRRLGIGLKRFIGS